jgi:HJR/Mrr/RecB family endonuclease
MKKIRKTKCIEDLVDDYPVPDKHKLRYMIYGGSLTAAVFITGKAFYDGDLTLEQVESAFESAGQILTPVGDYINENPKTAGKIAAAGGLIGLIVYAGKDLFKKRTSSRERKKIKNYLKHNFSNVKPYEFEKFIGKLLKKMGYRTEITPESNDFGVDVVAWKKKDKYATQVKRYAEKHNVTSKEVQQLIGARHFYKANKAIFVTTSNYTPNAKKVAEYAPIELWDKEKLHSLVRKYCL